MKIHKRIFYIFGLLLLGTVSCQKDKIVVEEKQWKTNDPQSVNEVRVIFAQTLAKAMSNEPLRKYVHEKMLQAYNTDYEMVYIAEKNKVIYDGKTMADILKSYADPEVLEKHGDNFFMKLTDISPLLSITMPDLSRYNATTWDNSVVPQVAAVIEEPSYSYRVFKGGEEKENPVNFRNENDDEYDYYEDDDFFGETTLGVWEAEIHYLVKMDGKTTWEKPVEDYMPDNGTPKSLCLPLLQQALAALDAYDVNGQQFHLIEHRQLLQLYYDCISANGNSGGGNPPCAEECERDCEDLNETLIDFKINGWRVFQNIRNQAFENHYVFWGDILGAERSSLSGTGTAYVKRFVSEAQRRRDLLNCDTRPCQGRWVTANYAVRSPDWDKAFFADKYLIDWLEWDNGSTTVSASLSLSAKFVVKVDSSTSVETAVNLLNIGISRTGSPTVPLGSQHVNYCDPIMHPNPTGSLQFRCN